MNELETRVTVRPVRPLAAAVMACLAVPQLVQAQAQAGAERPEEIIVTSSIIAQPRRQIATAVSSIDFEEIELRGYVDMADVLRTQTAIGVSNSGGPGKATAVRIRGEEAYRTMLIIDGVKAVDPSSPQVGPDFSSLLTTNDLQRVEVLRGPQGFIYGADAGGVINVMTKRGDGELGGRLALEGGDFATRKLDAALSGGGDAGDYYVSVVDFETDGFNARTTDTVLQDKDGADNTTLHGKFGWNLSENARLQLVIRDIDAEAKFDNCFGGPPLFASSNDCVTTTEQRIYKLSADFSSGDFTNTFGYSESEILRDNLTAGVSSFSTDGQLGRFEYTGSYKPSDAFALVYGVDLLEEELVDGDGPDSRDQDGIYVEYQGAFDDAWFLTVGARHDDNEDFGSYTSSRLSLAYVQELGGGRSLKYRGSMGTGFRAPSLYEVAFNAGPSASPPAAGTALKEETSEGYDVGLEYDAGNGLHFEITYFDQDIENAIEFDPVGFSGYLQTAGRSTSTGVEIGANVPLGERWELLANWTQNDAKMANGQARLRRPEHVGNFGIVYRPADTDLRFIANYRLSREAIDTFNGVNVPLPDYEVLDLAVNWDATEKVQIYGRLQNATDEKYQEITTYNTAERSLYGGVRWIF